MVYLWQMELVFNEHGFLVPCQPLEADLRTMEQVFVEAFPDSATRKKLFLHFLRYLEEFKSRVSRRFTVWVNGSYVTRRLNPDDLDFVVFLDHQVYKAQEPFLDKFWSFSLEAEGLDAYLVREFPAGHPLHLQTLSDKALWLSLYQKTKWNEDNTFYAKGFLELNFS
jgi:hypothetical protein